jgi:long-chain fatty acid transport protein
MVARKVSNNVSLGLGVQIQQVEAELTNAIDFGLIGTTAGVTGATPGVQDGFVRVTGEDWGAGLVLGLMHEADENTRWGFSYRSQVNHRLQGNARFSLDSSGIGLALRNTTGAFQNSGVTADLSTPAVLGVGLSHYPAPKWNFLFDLTRTFWASFDELRLKFENPAQADAFTQENWQDTWFVSMGTTFQPNEYWTLRFGLAYDQGPVTDNRRVPRVPTSSSRWLSLGTGYRAAENITIEFGFSHLWYDDALINLSAADPGNAALGNLQGRFNTSLDMIGLSVQVGY